MPSPRKRTLAKVRRDLRKVSYRHLLTALRPARHLRAALGAPLLVTGYSHCVGLLVAAIGAHAVATGTGGLSTTHPARPASATTPSTTTTAASTSTTSTHLTHPLSLSTPALAPFGAGRRVTSLLPVAASTSRWPGRPPAQHNRGGEQLVQRRTATVRAGDSIVTPHQYFKRRVAGTTAILVDWHRALLTYLVSILLAAGDVFGVQCRPYLLPVTFHFP